MDHFESTIRRLKALDPANTTGVPTAPDGVPWNTTAHMRTGRFAASGRGRSVSLLAGAALLVIALLVVGSISNESSASAAAPAIIEGARSVPARDELLVLAERSERSGQPRDITDVGYVRSVDWNSRISVSGEVGTMSISQSDQQLWLNTNGSAQRSSMPGPDIEVGEVVQVPADLPPPESGQVTESSSAIVPLLKELPSDTVLRDQFLAFGSSAAPESYRVFDGIYYLLSNQPVAPGDRGRLLRLLSETEGVAYSGEVTDRAGRTGKAFTIRDSHTGATTDHTMILNGETGELLDYEEVWVESPSALNVEVPVVSSYKVILSQGFVSEVGDHP